MRSGNVLISHISLLLVLSCSNTVGNDDGNGGGSGNAGNASGNGGGSAATGAGGAGNTGNPGGNGGGSGGISVGQGGSASGTGTGGGESCAGETHEPENGPAVLQLVVDTSLSMNEMAPGGGGSKWVVTRNALATALDQLSPQTSVGLMFYPNRDTNVNASDTPRELSACLNVEGTVPIGLLGDVGSPQRLALSDALGLAGPDGSTPTHDAYKYALDNSISTTTQVGRRFMLLITDGVPTFDLECVGTGLPGYPSDTQAIIDEIAGAAQNGIQTFIIGSPGSENDGMGGDARPWMSRGAIAGGTARAGCSETAEPYCHFDMTTEPDFAVALSEALNEIAGAVVSCSYVIPTMGSGGQTVDRNRVNIRYTPGGSATEETIFFSEDPNCSEGWRYEGENEIVLCPATCSRVQADAQASLEVEFGCLTETKPPE